MDNIGDPTSAVTPTSADAAFEQAMALHGENRLDEAERLDQAALSLDPGHAGALCYLGLLRLQQDRPEDSVTLLEQAIERDAGAAEAHHHLGVALARLGVYGQALACQDTALALIPDYGDALHHRGQALHALGRVPEAIASYEAALAQSPDDPQLELALAAALEASGRDEEAFVHCRNAVGFDPALADRLSQAIGRYGQRQPARAQAGMQRLNRYIGTFLTNQANARMGVYPGLASAPYHDVARLPGALALERNYAAIKAEIEALAATEFQAEAENLMERGAWDVFLFYERSRKNEENCARCPTITRIIEANNTVRTRPGCLRVEAQSGHPHPPASRADQPAAALPSRHPHPGGRLRPEGRQRDAQVAGRKLHRVRRFAGARGVEPHRRAAHRADHRLLAPGPDAGRDRLSGRAAPVRIVPGGEPARQSLEWRG